MFDFPTDSLLPPPPPPLLFARYFKEYSKYMRVSYMPDYQKVVLVLLQLLLVLMGRSGYGSQYLIVYLFLLFFSFITSNLCPMAIIADVGQGREDDMLHCQHCRVLSPDSKLISLEVYRNWQLSVE
jgi:hypothetical protein